MSRENAEIVRRLFDLAMRQREMDAAIALFAPDAVLDWSDSLAPYSGIYHGHAEIRKAWQGCRRPGKNGTR